MILVVPCYNEWGRFSPESWVDQATRFDAIFFVDDGSTDNTAQVLNDAVQAICTTGAKAEVVSLPGNQGKGEAVRQGLLCAVERYPEAGTLAYCDSDLSTSLDEMLRLESMFKATGTDLLIGSRLKMAGRHIKRKAVRHYLGRVSATLISELLGLEVYDTQAGAKLIRAAVVKELCGAPFISRWLFDCELLLRARRAGLSFREEPLERWVHQATNSKISPFSYLRSLLDLIRIWLANR